jgi:hypothetical protein
MYVHRREGRSLFQPNSVLPTIGLLNIIICACITFFLISDLIKKLELEENGKIGIPKKLRGFLCAKR